MIRNLKPKTIATMVALLSIILPASAISTVSPSLAFSANDTRSKISTPFLPPIAASDTQSQCQFGYVPCGEHCCSAGSICTTDANANLACCPTNTYCTGTLAETTAKQTVVYTTNTPVGSGRRLTPPVLSYIAGLVRAVTMERNTINELQHNNKRELKLYTDVEVFGEGNDSMTFNRRLLGGGSGIVPVSGASHCISSKVLIATILVLTLLEV